MKELKNISNKKIVIISITIMIIVLVLGFTYAYWTRTFTQSGVNRNTYDCFDINFKEKVEGITIENGYPLIDEEGMQSKAYEVEITNTCNIAASYNVVLNKLNTSTLDSSHIKIAVDNDIRLLSETENTSSTIENAIEGRIISSGVLAGKDSKTISIRSWMDEATTIEEGSNKVFENKITIEAVTSNQSNLLAAHILSENIKNEKPDFTSGFPLLNNQSGSGLYSTEDDDGKSYYYRGDIKNNYIKFGKYKSDLNVYELYANGANIPYDIYYDYDKITNECNNYFNIDYNYDTAEDCIANIKTRKIASRDDPILWRIVRVNGNGTIRIVTEEIIDLSAFNDNVYKDKYVGYTYDNNYLCTKAHPCTKTTGTSSTIKNTLENWYDNNISSFDNEVILGDYCNDTTYIIDQNNKLYNSVNRVSSGNPSLKCPDTNENYGGLYKLKIGLLSADEANFAGFSWDTPYAILNNYLFKKEINFWLFSASGNSESQSTDFITIAGAGFINDDNANMQFNGIRPVINLRSDVKIKNGVGTKENPYIIE